MTEQTTYPVEATVESDGRVSVRHSEAITGSPQAMTSLHNLTSVAPETKAKTLAERFNEAYDEDARREDEEFFRATRAYYRRRSNNEN